MQVAKTVLEAQVLGRPCHYHCNRGRQHLESEPLLRLASFGRSCQLLSSRIIVFVVARGRFASRASP